MQSTTPLSLNLQFPNYSTTMYAVQHDRLSRKITAVLADGAAPFAPEYGTLAVVRYKKPDGTCGFYDTDEDGNDAVTWEDNVATIMLAEQALTVAGTVLCQVQFYNGDEQRLSSFTWKIIVEENVCPDETITSSDYFNILTQQIASIMEVITDLPVPSTVLPEMDGTAAIGVRGEFARADHVHPSDTSKADASDVVTLQNDVSALQNTAVTGITYVEQSVTVSFSAGTIGTRGYQTTFAAPTGKKLIGAVVTYLGDSTACVPSLVSSSGTLYLNVYRATSSAVSNVKIDVRYTFVDT